MRHKKCVILLKKTKRKGASNKTDRVVICTLIKSLTGHESMRYSKDSMRNRAMTKEVPESKSKE